MSPAVDTEVGGFAGKVVVVTIAEVNDGCFTEPPAEGLEGKLYFVIPNGLPPSGPPARAPGRQLLPGSRDTLWIIDVDGHRVVIATSQTDPSDSDAIAAVIDSIEFAVR